MKNKKDIIRAIAMIALLLILLSVCLMCTACAPAAQDTNGVGTGSNKTSEYAIIRLPDDTIIQGYVDYEYTNTVGCVEIVIDGVKYLTHWANVVVFNK